MSREPDDVKVDVAQTKELEIPRGQFPVPYPCSDFRICVRPEAHEHMLRHSKTDTSIELCGMLIGEVLQDDFGHFVVVDEMIEGEHADGSLAGVTFTQETWAHIFHELDVKHPGKRIVGWYHTHPGFGVFLSSMDTFIHNNFFNLPWQIAYVVDPLAHTEGAFEWRNGRAVPSVPYWIGEVLIAGAQQPLSRSDLGEKDRGQSDSAAEHGEQTDVFRESSVPEERPWATYVAWHVIQIVVLLAILCMVLSGGKVEKFIERLFLYWLI